jgi:HSP20 family molecular chaperone IbpA
MTSQRDPFADFARMRREMDELLGDFWDQAGTRKPRQAVAFVPRVDVYYCGEDAPEKAIVKVELPGIALEAVNLEVTGRTLVIRGERPDLPAGRASLRPVPASGRAIGRCRRGARAGHLRGRDPQG